MGKLFEGIRYEKKILCPKCLVQPESIYNYGTDQKGFWFKGRCPHCNNTIIWYRNVDLSFGELPVENVEICIVIPEPIQREKG